MSYLGRLRNRPKTPQWLPIPGTAQVANSAGGYAWSVDDWKRLDRFLILGSEGGTYYIGEASLTAENANAVRRCVESDGQRTVQRIVKISETGRAPKNDPAIFALAMAASYGDDATRHSALAALPRVCRIGTHLFRFAEYVEGFRGWGRGLRSAVADWYAEQSARDLAYQAIKYQAREGWSHRDLLRLAHPKGEGAHQTLYHWMVKGWDGVGDEPHPDPDLRIIWAFERAKRAADAGEIVDLVREHRLPREAVPTQWLTRAEVWEALLDDMPMTAMIRNLATMTRVGLIAPGSDAAKRVVAELADARRLRGARVHPIAVLAAMLTYAAGHGVRGKGTWEPVQQVVDALDGAFYAAFQNVEATGQRWLLGLDVSGSMGGGMVAGVPGLTPRVASAAMALITAATERDATFMGFCDKFVPLPISPRQRLDTVVKTTDELPFGGTDCALPMLWAAERKVPVDVFAIYTDSETWYGDVFAIYTDSETWYGDVHPAQALRKYREKMGIASKLIVVGMVSNRFSIADPDDAGMLDVVGFDTATPSLCGQFAVGAV